MTTKELEELLPLYLNGTLDDETRRQVDAALEVSPELRQSLQVWEGLRHSLLLEKEMETESHPTAEQIVDYATHELRDPAARVALERHIQGCPSCLKEVSVIREMEAAESPGPVERRRRVFFRDFRLSLLLPIGAAVFLVVFFLTREEPTQQMLEVPPPAREQSQPARPPVVLTYSLPLKMVIMRGTRSGGESVPEFFLDEADSVAFRIPVVYSKAAEGYDVKVAASDGSGSWAEFLQPHDVTNGIAHLVFVVSKEQVKPGKYQVSVKEKLQDHISGIEPEKYSYELLLKLPQK